MFRVLKADEIEVKVKQVGAKGAVALLYKTARTDMQLLDEVVGAFNWETDYKEIKGNLYCGIGVFDEKRNTIVWKWDCGTESREDGEGNEKKGEASDAFKRAGFKWGIGRELYTSPFIFLNVETEKDGNKWRLSDKFITFEVKSIDYNNGAISSVVITDSKGKVVYQTSGNPNTERKQKTDKPANKKLQIDTDLHLAGVDIQNIAKYFGVTLDKLTDEMKTMALKQKRKEISLQELEEYKQDLNYDS